MISVKFGVFYLDLMSSYLLVSEVCFVVKVCTVSFAVYFIVFANSCLCDEMVSVPLEFDRSSPLGARVAAYVEEHNECPGINAFSKLLVGTPYDFEAESAVMRFIDQIMDSEKRIPEIKKARKLFRTDLEPLSYTAKVTSVDLIAKTRNVSRDSVAIDGYRVKYLRNGLHDRNNSQRTLSGHGFDGDFYYRYDATINLASGYVGFPPTSRSMFFPRSHLLQRLFLMDRGEDLLGDKTGFAMNLSTYSGYTWNYDGPAINGKKNLIVYGDARSYLILDMDNNYSVVGGVSGLVTVEKGEDGNKYIFTNSHSEQTTQGIIELKDGKYIPKTMKNVVFQNGKEVLTETIEIVEFNSGESLSDADFDVIPDGVAVMNEVENLGYRKGGD